MVVIGFIILFIENTNKAVALETSILTKEVISSSIIDENSKKKEPVVASVPVEEDINESSEELDTTSEPIVDSVPEETPVITDSKTFSISEYASSFKSYMDYRAITNTSSIQYEMQKQAYTDENGLRKIGEHFCVAMGTYYGNLGDILYVETDEGAGWTVILSDIKSDKHTDSTHRYTVSNHCMMEFIVDTPAMSTAVKRSGTVNSLGFQGKICYIEKIG